MRKEREREELVARNISIASPTCAKRKETRGREREERKKGK